jgi:alkylhydroperoxidase family enzyme
MDIGSAVSRAMGVTDAELAALGDHRASELFSPLETLVLDLAVAMTDTPAEVPDELREGLLTHLTPGQFAEVAAVVAWENHRARLNRSVGAREAGFSDGAYCVVPHRPDP